MNTSDKIKNGLAFHAGKRIPASLGLGEDDTFARIENEFVSDYEKRKDRRSEFKNLFPSIERIPWVGDIAKGFYAHGGYIVLSMVVVLLIFTAIKAPYFGVPFTGEHPTKYNTYVEPALYMSQTNNPLLYQKKYVADPVTNPEGTFKKFDHLPLLEWGLFFTYKTIPFGSLETRTRLFTHFIGLMILVFAYLFFVRWLPESLTLLTVGMMSINPIIVFGTYVTVLDGLAILSMFLSFIMLNTCFEQGKFPRLFWAGIIYGIGVSVKHSLVLWMAPISLLLIYYERDSTVSFLRNFLIYTLLGILVIITFKTSVAKMIGSPVLSAGVLILWIFFYWGLYHLLNRRQTEILAWIETVYRNKLTLILCAVMFLAACVAVFTLFRVGDYAELYLTDRTLLFNLRLYKYMLLFQFKNYMTRTVFWLGIFGFVLVFAFGNARSRRLVASFLFGSVAYWAIASKAMFFHNYYTLIFMILFSLTASLVIYYIYRNMPTIGAKVVLILLFSMLIIPPAQDAAVGKLKGARNVADVVKFILEKTEKNDFILYEGFLSPLVIYTGRGFVKPAILADDRIREEIHKLGFAETMRKYRIKYFFSPNEKPFYKDFVPLFAKTNLIEPSGTSINRNISIFRVIGQEHEEFKEDLKEIDQMEKEFDLPGKFKLVAKVGEYRFYTFRN